MLTGVLEYVKYPALVGEVKGIHGPSAIDDASIVKALDVPGLHSVLNCSITFGVPRHSSPFHSANKSTPSARVNMWERCETVTHKFKANHALSRVQSPSQLSASNVSSRKDTEDQVAFLTCCLLRNEKIKGRITPHVNYFQKVAKER